MHLRELFQRTVRMHGDRPALAVGKERAATYAGLDRRVRALAHWLSNGLRLAPGDRVAIAMQNGPQYLEALLALWHARLCAVPVNAKLHPKEIRHIAGDSGAAACISRGELLEELCRELPELRLVDAGGPEWRAVDAAPDATPRGASGDELAWLFYTSGTTGRPKGVMLTHDHLVAMALGFLADVQSIDCEDALLHAAPMSHGSGMYVVPYVLRGALQVVPASGGFDEAEIFELLRHHRSVSLFAAPTMVTRLVQHARTHGAAAGGLRTIITGGAPFYVEDVKAAVACFGPRIAQVYGQGESPMTITALRAEQIAAAVARGDDAMLASVGFAQAIVDVEIRDGEGQVLPAGAMGEVTVRGATVMRGYWNDPGATASTLPGGVLRTGDVGRLDERGLLFLVDRSKDVIISGGTNIYPREVEEVLLRHPAVREVAVVGVPDAHWGESVAAVVVAAPGAAPDAADLDRWCIDHIARFKRPKLYRFVDSLPQNATGKVLKTELRKAIAEPV